MSCEAKSDGVWTWQFSSKTGYHAEDTYALNSWIPNEPAEYNLCNKFEKGGWKEANLTNVTRAKYRPNQETGFGYSRTTTGRLKRITLAHPSTTSSAKELYHRLSQARISDQGQRSWAYGKCDSSTLPRPGRKRTWFSRVRLSRPA